MSETWGIVLRDRASGAYQWLACEVTRDGDIVTARAHGYEHRGIEYAQRAVAGVARKIERGDRTLISARCATPDEYAAHMENLRRILAADEVERLRAAVAERDATINDLRHASNRAAVAYAESLARCEAEAFRRGAEAAMIEAAGAARRVGAWHMAETIRALPLPAYAPSQPAQSDEATATSNAPLTFADATARARDAAMGRESAPITPRGREVRYADLRVGDRVRTCSEVAEVLRVDLVSSDEVTLVLRFGDHVERRERVGAGYLVEVVR